MKSLLPPGAFLKNFLKVYLSEKPGSLGGPPSLPLDNYSFYFDEEESFFGKEKYAFFYIVNDLEMSQKMPIVIKSIKIKPFFDIVEHQDKFNVKFLSNILVQVINTSLFGKNKIHLQYDEFGNILDFNRNISDFIEGAEEINELNINAPLHYKDFYPFAVKVSIINPIERVKNLPIIIKTKYIIE